MSEKNGPLKMRLPHFHATVPKQIASNIAPRPRRTGLSSTRLRKPTNFILELPDVTQYVVPRIKTGGPFRTRDSFLILYIAVITPIFYSELHILSHVSWKYPSEVCLSVLNITDLRFPKRFHRFSVRFMIFLLLKIVFLTDAH
jgi:hypothetical protein